MLYVELVCVGFQVSKDSILPCIYGSLVRASIAVSFEIVGIHASAYDFVSRVRFVQTS